MVFAGATLDLMPPFLEAAAAAAVVNLLPVAADQAAAAALEKRGVLHYRFARPRLRLLRPGSSAACTQPLPFPSSRRHTHHTRPRAEVRPTSHLPGEAQRSRARVVK